MQPIEPQGTRPWVFIISALLALVAWAAVARVVPGASCADGSPSHSIGRHGACSHHGGVRSGWGWIGLFPGLFVFAAGVNLLDNVNGRSRKIEKHNDKVVEASTMRIEPRREFAGKVPADNTKALRAAIEINSDVTFLYSVDGSFDLAQAYPRWIQMAEVHGERTLCVIADCRGTGVQRPFAIDRMSGLDIVNRPSLLRNPVRLNTDSGGR